MQIQFNHLPEVIREDPQVVRAMIAEYTTYVFNLADHSSTSDLRKFVVVVADGDPVISGGDALIEAPAGAKSVYVIIHLGRGNRLCSLYSIEDYRAKITPPAEALEA